MPLKSGPTIPDRDSQPLNLSSVLNYLTDLIVLCRDDFSIIESNNAADVILGTGDSLVGSYCYQVFHNREKPCKDCTLPETISKGTLTHLNYFDERFGEYFEERTHPIFSRDNQLRGFVLVCRNVTEIRQIEDKYAQAKKMAAIGQISSGAAHDFKNVITVLLGRVRLMRKLTADREILNHLDIVERAAHDGAETVRRMQEFTRSRKKVDFENLDLKDLVEDVIALTRPKWREATESKGIIVKVIADVPRGIIIWGNNSELHNALTNLIFNAVDAMPDGGILSLQAERFEANVLLRVKDTGIGMTDETREKIFDPFFTTKGDAGTGLGMSEVFGIVKRHNGSISVESRIGKGTAITLNFPLSEAVPEEEKAEEILEVHSARILSIDDEAYILDALVDLLREDGHTVVGYQSAEKALEEFRANTYDMVFTDLEMPEMSGQAVADKIKSINVHTPVILLSGWLIDLEEEQELSKVVDFSLSKPFSVEDIRTVVAQAYLLGQERKGKDFV